MLWALLSQTFPIPSEQFLPSLQDTWSGCRYHQTPLCPMVLAAGAGSVYERHPVVFFYCMFPSGEVCHSHDYCASRKKQTWNSLYYYRSWAHRAKGTACASLPFPCPALCFPSWDSGSSMQSWLPVKQVDAYFYMSSTRIIKPQLYLQGTTLS